MSYSIADIVRAPSDPVTINEFGVLKFTVTTTHAVNAIPDSWSGKYVNLYSATEFDFAFSKRSTAEVDISVSATAAGASTKVGGKCQAGERRQFQLPHITLGLGEHLYFVREAAASGTIFVELAST